VWDSERVNVERVNALLVLFCVVEYGVNPLRVLGYGTDGDDDPAVAQASLDEVVGCHAVGPPERVVLVLATDALPGQCLWVECG